MSEFWHWFLDWWPAIVSSCTAVVGAVASYVVYRFKLRVEKEKNAALNEELRRAMVRLTYCDCPNCGNKILLADCQWKLPGGYADQNLNGVPDDQES